MRIVQINTFSNKSTGNIMQNIHRSLLEDKIDSYVCWGRGKQSENNREIVISDNLGIKLHGAYTRLFDKTAFASKRATLKLIDRLDEICPDIIHLHNIHGYYLNAEILFNYIKKRKIKVIWTFHDCWPFTGHCTWFDVCGCNKWQNGCYNCDQIRTYPSSLFIDNSAWNWKKKRELFTGLDMTIVTPSKWLAGLVKQSFLKDYPLKVIRNGIDTSVFAPRDTGRLREKYGFDDRKIVLGVAKIWEPRKGLNDFIVLSKLMPEFQFAVVGLTKSHLPGSLKAIKHTETQEELAELYSLADLFFNPTYEDNYPTTNLEAIACGTFVMTYNTGGSPEFLDICKSGKIICKNDSRTVDFNKVRQEISDYLSNPIPVDVESIKDKLDISFCYKQYLSLYENLTENPGL